MSFEASLLASAINLIIDPAIKEIIGNIGSAIQGRLPVVSVGEDDKTKLLAPSERFCIGQTVKDGKKIACIVVEDETGPAFNEAKAIEEKYPSDFTVIHVGRAFGLLPGEHAVENDLKDKGPKEVITDWRPGRSASHGDGAAGTIGAFVRFRVEDRNKKRTLKGFVSAAHVLAYRGKGKVGDPIQSPGYPDRPRNIAYDVARLQSSCRLVHYVNQLDSDKVINATDIAAAAMDSDVDYPGENLVPDPRKDGNGLMPLKGIVNQESVLDLIFEESEVFTIGRTSGFARGRISSASIQAFPIRLGDRKAYMYGDVNVITPSDPESGFSAPGDSGAPVYTQSGMLIGFVVGGSGSKSFMQPALSCLEAIDARLEA